jgi:hypothetical protein
MSTECRDSRGLPITPNGNGFSAFSKAPKRHESRIADTSTKGHDSLALGISPKGNGVPALSKVPKHHEPVVVDRSTKGHGTLGLSIMSKGHDSAGSSKTPKQPGAGSSKTPKQPADTLTESGHSQGQDVASKVHKATKPSTVPETHSDKLLAFSISFCAFAKANVCVATAVTGEPKRGQAAVPAAQDNPSGPSLDASSHVTGAVSALVALSTLREKGGHQGQQ